MASVKSHYIPGVCNIGPAEIKARKKIGIIWIIISLILFGILYFFHAPAYLRLIVALPLVISMSGFYQAAFHFCAGLGAAGLYNFSDTVGKTDSVEQAEFRKKDKQKAQQILGLSIATALILAFLLCLIP